MPADGTLAASTPAEISASLPRRGSSEKIARVAAKGNSENPLTGPEPGGGAGTNYIQKSNARHSGKSDIL